MICKNDSASSHHLRQLQCNIKKNFAMFGCSSVAVTMKYVTVFVIFHTNAALKQRKGSCMNSEKQKPREMCTVTGKV